MARRTGLLVAAGLMGLAFALGGRRKVSDDCGDIYEPDEPASPVEPYAAYVGQSTCDPEPKPGVLLFREYVRQRFGGGDLGITRSCAAAGVSEHEEGRAWDWGTIHGADISGVARWPADVAGFLDWLFCTDRDGNENANARRAGVMYLVHKRRIWRAYDKPGQPGGSWYDYHGADPHETHLHVSFSWAGANGETSLYDKIRGASGGPELERTIT